MPGKSNCFPPGTKVKYTHGKGLSTGEIIQVNGDMATLKSKNGNTINRQVKRLKRIAAQPASV